MLTAKRLALPLLLASALMAGCAAPPFTSSVAAEIGYEALGPYMQYDDKFLMAWLPGTAAQQPEVARQLTAELARVISQGAQKPVFVTVSGDNSAFTAQLIRDACALLPGALPNLRLVFVGNPAHAEEARSAVLARRGTFYFEPVPK